MTALFRSVICGIDLTDEERDLYSPEMLQSLLRKASSHDIAHLLVWGLKKNGLIPGDKELEQYVLKAVYRYEQLKYDYDKLCRHLEKVGIPFLPLKGSITREHYPEPWMRTSCDIDVLVRKEDLDRAVATLEKDLGYVNHGKSPHDVSLFTPHKMHIELHYTLLEEGYANESSKILGDVWKTATLREGWSSFYEMSDEMFYFYHIAHMAKHFENGGCGIKPFIDLWILDNKLAHDRTKIDALLKKGRLFRFSEVVRHLCGIWFDFAEHNDVSRQLESYVLKGGVYGNNENRIIVQQQKKGGRVKYALSKIFIPYDVIKFHYPILEKYPILTPIMEVRRWCKLIFCGHLKRTTKELKYNNHITDEEAENMRRFLADIGL